MIDLFTYGTLSSRPDESVIQRRPERLHGLLSGYERREVRNAHFPAIMPGSREVQGIIYTGLSQQEIHLLDTYESNYYLRRTVSVKCEQTFRACEAYIWRPDLRHLLGDCDWDYQAWVTKHYS